MNPALALLEFGSIAAGIQAGDAMIKRGPVAEIIAGTVHPGRYLSRSPAKSEQSRRRLRRVWRPQAAHCSTVFLPDVHPTVADAVRGERLEPSGEALGVIETTTVAAAIEAADAAVKGATVIPGRSASCRRTRGQGLRRILGSGFRRSGWR